MIIGKLSFMPFSGSRGISGLGKDDDLCLEIISKCENLLADNPDYPEPVSNFYRALIEDAERENQRKLDEDKAELEEEEF